MKNEINTDQFHVKTGFLGNGQRNLISTSVNTETGSHKYGNGQTKIENGNGIPQIRKWTDKNRKRNGSEWEYFRPFSTLMPSRAGQA